MAEREKTLFNPDGGLYLKDQTPAYLTGRVLSNPQARRDYSPGERGDAPEAPVNLGMKCKKVS